VRQESGMKFAIIVISVPEASDKLQAGLCPAPCVSGLKLAVIDFSMPEISISTNYSLVVSLL